MASYNNSSNTLKIIIVIIFYFYFFFKLLKAYTDGKISDFISRFNALVHHTFSDTIYIIVTQHDHYILCVAFFKMKYKFNFFLETYRQITINFI